MLSREVTGDGVRVVDGAGRSFEVRATDWTPGTGRGEFSVPTDEVAGGRATGFRVTASMGVVRSDGDRARRLVPGADVTLADGRHVVDAAGPVGVLARFDGPATVRASADEVVVSFDARTRVDFGFLDRTPAPDATVRVPATPDGLATAVEAMTAAHRTTTPDRARPTMRRHPPRLAFDDAVAVPDDVAAAVPETGVRVEAPASLRGVLDAAPLAYYLGASVAASEGALRVVAPDAGVDADLESAVGGEDPAARLLERAFWLDALAWPGGDDPLLAALDLDPATVADATPGERLALALDAPFGQVADRLPEWPVATYVAPTAEYVRALPAVLDRLAHVHPPETEPLESRDLVERTLDDFYRGAPGPVATVEMENPRLRRGRTHGWLAEGTPIDVFKALPEAFEHGHERPAAGSALSVSVVLNEPEMTRERDRVADIYRTRADDAPLDVTLRTDLSRDELASVFESETDFVHYIGHCDEDGLLCSDGTLAASTLDGSNARTFFLNACGSYYEGLDLVRKGSVAGAVTFRKVLDEHAARVGTAFARLLLAGFTVERALAVARRRIVMGKDYAVVGDGTWTVSRGGRRGPGVFTVDSRRDGYHVEYDPGNVWTHGEHYPSPFSGDGVRPYGSTASATLDANALADVLDGADAPVVLDGEFCWSDEAAARLRN